MKRNDATLILIVLGIGSICAACGALYLGTSWLTEEKIEEARLAIEVRGEPLHVRELRPPNPQGRIWLQRATRLWVPPPASIVGGETVALPADPQDARQWISRSRPVLDAIQTAVDHPDPTFRIAFGDSSGPSIFDLGRLLGTRALLAAREGRPDAAYRDVERMLRLARRVTHAPGFGSLYARLPLERQAVEILGALLADHGPAPSIAQRLCSLLEEIDVAEILRQTWIEERSAGEQAFDVQVSGDPEDPSLHLDSPARILRRLAYGLYLEWMAEALALVRHPWHEARDAWQELDELWWQFGRLRRSTSSRPSIVPKQAEIHRARLDLAWIALDFELQRAERGSYPSELPDPRGERGVLDPFSGETYRWEATGTRFHIECAEGPRVQAQITIER